MQNLIERFMSWLGGILNWMSSTDRIPDDIYPIPSSVPSPAAPLATTTPPIESVTETKPIETPRLLWDTPQQAFKSVRILCDDMGLNYDQKNEICYTIYNESEFKKGARGKPNKNGSIDHGICQYNDGKNAKGIPLWIGKGATFSSVDEVYNNPEKCVRVMIQEYKVGHIGWWYGHKSYSQATVQNSPMWTLRVV